MTAAQYNIHKNQIENVIIGCMSAEDFSNVILTMCTFGAYEALIGMGAERNSQNTGDRGGSALAKH